MIASSYPLLDAFLTLLWVFLFVVWIWLLFTVFADLFRSHDLSGWAKAAWLIGILIFPLLGVLIYLIVRGAKMHERGARAAEANQAAFRDYVRSAAGPSTDGPGDQLEKLVALRDSGVLTSDEFDRAKAKALGG